MEVPPAAPEGGAASASPAPAPTEAPAAPVKLGPIHKLTVTDLDGNPVSLAKFAGRPMIIEIWETWCGPCRVNRNNIHKNGQHPVATVEQHTQRPQMAQRTADFVPCQPVLRKPSPAGRIHNRIGLRPE